MDFLNFHENLISNPKLDSWSMLSIISACDTHYSFKYTLIGPDSIVISYLVIPTSGCAYILKTQAPTDPSFTHKDQENLKKVLLQK